MKRQCLIIGGGLAGLVAGIRCAEAGLTVAVVSSGESGLTFASGGVDVLGYMPGSKERVSAPFAAIDELVNRYPEHPYARIGQSNVFKAMDWFRGTLAEAGLDMVSANDEQQNQWQITAAGALRPTWLRQSFPTGISLDMSEMRRVVFVNVTGFLDFMPELAAIGLKRYPAFKNTIVDSLNIDLPLEHGMGATADTMRSAQLCRAMGDKDFDIIATTLIEKAQDASLVVMPACLDSRFDRPRLNELRRRTGLNIITVATLPPSLPGMDILQALRHRFTALGGFLVSATEIRHSMIENGRVHRVSNGEDLLEADHFVLATGSFFSKGLSVKLDDPENFTLPMAVKEPVFGLDLKLPPTFSERQFLSPTGQGFIRAGVTLNAQHQPMVNGEAITNLHVAGMVLGGCDPVQECSGSGVSVSTAWLAAERIIDSYCQKAADEFGAGEAA